MTRGPEEPEGREETPLSCARASLCRRDTGKKDKNVRGARWEGGKGGEAFFCLFPLPIIPRALCLLPLYASSAFPTMHLICPLRFYISIVFNFSWDGFNIHEKGKTKIMRFFGGRGAQIRCIMGNVEVAYCYFYWAPSGRREREPYGARLVVPCASQSIVSCIY